MYGMSKMDSNFKSRSNLTIFGESAIGKSIFNLMACSTGLNLRFSDILLSKLSIKIFMSFTMFLKISKLLEFSKSLLVAHSCTEILHILSSNLVK